MANKIVRLVKRIKITDALTQGHLSKFSWVITPEEFQAFQSDVAKNLWRFCPVVKDAKGRYNLGRVQLPGYASIEGPVADVDRRAGSFHLDYREAGNRMRPTVLKVLSDTGREGVTLDNLSSKDITDAIGIVERRLDGIKHGDITVGNKPEKKRGDKTQLLPHISQWLRDRTPHRENDSGENTLEKNTLNSYSRALHLFGEFITEKRKHPSVKEITEADLKAYYGYLATMPRCREAPKQVKKSLASRNVNLPVASPEKVGLSAASRNVNLTIVSTFLRTSGRGEILESWNGVRKVPTVKRAANEETDIDDYTDEQISAMFAIATQEERELFEFFLGTGMRAGEVAVAEWTDLHPMEGVIKVRKKTVRTGKGVEVNWVPKYKKEREIPVPRSLLLMLAARKKRVPASNLIFPVYVVFPNSAYLRVLKSLGHRAGIACGTCDECKVRERTKKGGCKDIYLHRWRHTFACRHLRGNSDGTGKFDVKTVSTWLGHKSIEITERYLHAARGSEVQQKINVGPMSRPF